MSISTDDLGIITVILERLETQRLPTALAIKEKVDSGECLNESEIDFFKEIFEDSQNMMPQLERHPEYQELFGRLTSLYHEIIEKATQNQQASKGA